MPTSPQSDSYATIVTPDFVFSNIKLTDTWTGSLFIDLAAGSYVPVAVPSLVDPSAPFIAYSGMGFSGTITAPLEGVPRSDLVTLDFSYDVTASQANLDLGLGINGLLEVITFSDYAVTPSRALPLKLTETFTLIPPDPGTNGPAPTVFTVTDYFLAPDFATSGVPLTKYYANGFSNGYSALHIDVKLEVDTTAVSNNGFRLEVWNQGLSLGLLGGGNALTPSVMLTKSAATTPNDAADAGAVDHAGQVITYTLTATNTGPVTLTNVVVHDAQAPGGIAGTIASLAPGASANVQYSINATQAELDAGLPIVNHAFVTDDQLANADATTTVPVDQDPTLSLLKTDAGVTDANHDGRQDAGDTVTYTYTLTNTGNVTLGALSVTDDNGTPGNTGDDVVIPVAGSLAPGASTQVTQTFVLTQSDFNAGQVTNIATDRGTGAGQTVSAQASDTVALEQNPDLSIVKTGDLASVDTVGQVIHYTIKVTNDGNVDLTGVTVTDPFVTDLSGPTGDVGNDGILGVGEVWTYTASHTVVASDFTGIADFQAALPSTATIVVDYPGNALQPSYLDVHITNGGVLNGLYDDWCVDTDRFISPGSSYNVNVYSSYDPAAAALFDPGETPQNLDLINWVINQNYAGTASPGGYGVYTAGDVQRAIWNLIGDTDAGAGGSDDNRVGEIVAAAHANGENFVPDCGDSVAVILVPVGGGNQVTIAQVTFADVELVCGITNTAFVTDDQGNIEQSSFVTDADANPALSLLKTDAGVTDANHDGRQDAGDTVTYTYTLTNTGNVTLGALSVTDDNGTPGNTGDDVVIPVAGSLAPGASTQVTQTFVLTQADFNAGQVTNIATDRGTGAGQTVSAQASDTVALEQNPDLSIVKHTSDPVASVAGQVLHYTIDVTNTGNVDLNGVAVSDPFVTDLSGPTGDVGNDGILGVGEVWHYTASHTVTQAEIDSSSQIYVSNMALANGSENVNFVGAWAGGGHVEIAGQQMLTVNYGNTYDPAHTFQVAAWCVDVFNNINIGANSIVYTLGQLGVPNATDIAKLAAWGDGYLLAHPGDALVSAAVQADIWLHEYAGLALGGGNDPALAGEIAYIDSLLPGLSVPGGDVQLGGSTAQGLTVAQGLNVSGGLNNRITNTATVTATGVTPDGDDISSVSSVVEGNPDLTLVKYTSTASVSAANQQIGYTLDVTNTGNIDFAGSAVVITDPGADGGAVHYASGDVNSDNLLNPGETWHYTAVHTVTQAEMDAGGAITNTATVSSLGVIPDADDTSSVSTAVVRNPGQTILKTVTGIADSNHDGITGDAGDVIGYNIHVANAGNVTLHNVTVTDPLTGGVISSGVTLAVGASEDIVTSYTLTQADIDTHTASADGTADDTITNTATVTSTEAAPHASSANASIVYAPQISISKLTNGADGGSYVAGSAITWTYDVTNTGDVTLAAPSVSDSDASVHPALVGGDANSNGLLDVGETWHYAAYGIAITGPYSNTGYVNDHTASGAPVSASDGSAYTGTPIADLSVTKTDGQTSVIAGAQDTYTITVTNNGPSTVSALNLSDSLPAALLSPVFTPSTGTYNAATGDWTGLSLGSGQSVTMTLQVTVDPTATGSLTNTVTVTPIGMPDSNPTNNGASDTDTITQSGDLSITKTDGVATVIAGTTDSYTIVVRNTGPSAVVGASVDDALPSIFTGASWTAVGSVGASGVRAAGTGSIHERVNLAPGASVTYTVSGTVAANATGTLTNTATVTAPGGFTDTNGSNNSATDTDGISQRVDLSVSKTDGKTTVTAGTADTYTITVTNAGPSTISSLSLVDSLPASLLSPSWGAPSAGSYNPGTGVWSGLSLGTGQSVSITLSGTIDPWASSPITNSVTVAPLGGAVDSNPTNNSASDTDTIARSFDLSISKDDGKTTVTAGSTDTYTIIVRNSGPSAVSGARVVDTLPSNFTGASWTAVASAGSSVAHASGTGSINELVNLASGGTITYTLTGTVGSAGVGCGAGGLTNTASVAAPAGLTESNTSNNRATDTDTIATPAVSIQKLVSVDGGCTWLDANTPATGPTVGQGSGCGSPPPPQFKFIVRNIGDVTLNNLVLSDVNDITGSAVDLNGAAPGTDITITSLAAGASYTKIISLPWVLGQNTDTGKVSVTYGGLTLTDTDDANYYGGVYEGRGGLSAGYWSTHTANWDGTGSCGSSDVLYNLPTHGKVGGVVGVLLGDVNANGVTDGAETTLFIPLNAAQQLINSSVAATDARQILIRQALAAQLNIDNGDSAPGGVTVGTDLISDAVKWLRGQSPFIGYGDGSSGKVDSNNNGSLSTSGVGAEYNPATAAFTSTTLASSKNAWNAAVDLHLSPTDFNISGVDLKNALEAFNTNKLVTSDDGLYIGWNPSGGSGGLLTDMHANNAVGMWTVLKDAAVVHG